MHYYLLSLLLLFLLFRIHLLLLSVLLIFIIIIIGLTHSRTVVENTVETEPQPVALDFKNLSQYSSRSK